MIIEKYGEIPHSNDYYGKRIVCRNCGSRLIIQEDDHITYDGKENKHYLYLGDRIKFECPFCCNEHYKHAHGVIYKNRFCEFLDKHDKLCAVIVCIIYAVCHGNIPFICMDHKKGIVGY